MYIYYIIIILVEQAIFFLTATNPTTMGMRYKESQESVFCGHQCDSKYFQVESHMRHFYAHAPEDFT
jgi:hypothetical protein